MNQFTGSKQLLKKYGLRPSKRLGQNFLIDEDILKKIIQAAGLSSIDTVLEIGPGLGILTFELAKQVKKVMAVEKDKRMCKILRENLKDYKNVEIVNKDILDLGYQVSYIKYKLVANIPYYITSPVIRKFLETKNPPKLMVLMVQKEVAQRIVAKPPKMSLLSIAVQFYADAEIISYVSKKAFWPVPRVDSAIIRIIPRKSALLSTSVRDKFFKLVKTGFSSKRKMLKNNLPSTLLGTRKIEKILKELSINPKTRAENLSIKDWLNLFHKLNLV